MTTPSLRTGTKCQCAASMLERGQAGNSREAPQEQGSAALPANIWGAEKVGDERRCLFGLGLYLTYVITPLLEWKSRNFTENRHISRKVAKRKGMWLNKITDLLIT